jgi:TonB family protein
MDGLRQQIGDILNAIQAQDKQKELRLIQGFVIPAESKWFTEEFGYGYGGRMTAAYQRAIPEIQEDFAGIYEGNVGRGWTAPKLFEHSDPEKEDAAVDHVLECMKNRVSLYTTAFHGDSAGVYLSYDKDKNGNLSGGDPSGYFIYIENGFRFVPASIVGVLPREFPVRIKLDLRVMDSKQLNKVKIQYPDAFMKGQASGNVMIHVVVGTDGNIKEAKITEGNPALASAVLEMVKQYRYSPTMLDGDPVEVEFDYPVTFEAFHR